MATESTVCANGHPMQDEDTFCGACGAPSMADLLTPDPGQDTAAEATTPTPAHARDVGGARSHPLRGLLVALVAVVVVVVGINAMAGSDRSSGNRTSKNEGGPSTTASGDEIIGQTPYGCEVIRPPGGFDATMVRIPYCTEVHAIETYCGRPAGDVTVPPAETTLDGTTFRDFTGYPASYGDAYDRFVLTPLTVRDPQATLVRLACWNGSGHAWTSEEWSAAISPQ